MAKSEFLKNVREARNLLVHPRASADIPHLDAQSLGRTLGRADIWLTPSSVDGFSDDDFAELGADRQRELMEAVRDFEAVAQQVPPAQPATDAQYQAAIAALTRILRILEPYLPTREEAIKVHNAIKTVDFPDPVVNWDYEIGSDADDAPAVWVTAFVDELSVAGNQFGRLVSELTAKLRRALSAAGIPWWPYVRVRTVAEHMAR
jgi:hypothetical protein